MGCKKRGQLSVPRPWLWLKSQVWGTPMSKSGLFSLFVAKSTVGTAQARSNDPEWIPVWDGRNLQAHPVPARAVARDSFQQPRSLQTPSKLALHTRELDPFGSGGLSTFPWTSPLWEPLDLPALLNY